MMNHPDMYTKMAYKELELFAFEANREDKQLKIRWNDAGDFFSETYFNIAVDITKALLDKKYNVESYAYTKIAKFYKMGEQAGMIMNFSEGAKESERTEVGDLQKVKMSIIVPTQVFEGFFEKKGPHIQKDDTGKSKFKSPEHKRLLKEKIIGYYNMHPDPKYGYINKQLHVNNTFYTDELPNKIGETGEYNCIVLPNGDSDRPAQRRDVRYTLLLEH
jgi:DnaJ-class molecular chaperone